MDEYLGLPEHASQLFGNFLRKHIFERVTFKKIHFIDSASPNSLLECQRYAGLMHEAPIDIVCAGTGENDHLAFNDPPVADFGDPETVNVVELDDKCRQQQINDGCFDMIEDVPKAAITLTVPALMSAECFFLTVPGQSKSEAVFRTLQGSIETTCPASVLRRHKNVQIFLEAASAAEIIN